MGSCNSYPQLCLQLVVLLFLNWTEKCDLSLNPTSNIDGLKTEKEWRVDPDTFGSETACVRASYQEV